MRLVGSEMCIRDREFRSGKTQSLLWQDKISAVARQDLCCGKTRSLLWQETKESTKGAARSTAPLCGGGRRLPPLWVLVFVYFGLLGYISVLLGHLLTLLPYQLSRQIVHSFSSQPCCAVPRLRCAWLFRAMPCQDFPCQRVRAMPGHPCW